jgi:hypothetical protein
LRVGGFGLKAFGLGRGVRVMWLLSHLCIIAKCKIIVSFECGVRRRISPSLRDVQLGDFGVPGMGHCNRRSRALPNQ